MDSIVNRFRAFCFVAVLAGCGSRSLSVADLAFSHDARVSADFAVAVNDRGAATQVRRSFAGTAKAVHDVPPCKGCEASLEFFLAIDTVGGTLSGTIGLRWPAWPTLSEGVAAIKGAFASGVVSLEPFEMAFTSDCFTNKLAVSTLSAVVDPGSGKIVGTFSGKLITVNPVADFVATIAGGMDTAPPTASISYSSPLEAVDISFSEPVTAPAGALVSVLSTNGVHSFPLSGPVSRLRLYPLGAWPLNQTLTVVFPAGVVDLASNALVASKLTFTPNGIGAFTNFGFEPGVPGVSFSCGGIVQSQASVTPKKGMGMAHLQPNCLLSAAVLGQFDLPVQTTKFVVAVDLLSNSPSLAYYPDAMLTLAGPFGKRTVDLRKHLGKPAIPIDGSLAYPLYHTGFIDVTVDATQLAGQSVVLMVGRDPMPSKCPPTPQVPSVSELHGLLIDDVRLQ